MTAPRDRATALAAELDEHATAAAGLTNAAAALAAEAENLGEDLDAAHSRARALASELAAPPPSTGVWGPGRNSGLPWWSGVAWRGSPEALAAFVAGPRAGVRIDLVQMFSPANAPLAHSWDMIAGGPGEDPAQLDGALTFSKGGKQAAIIWTDPVVAGLPVALSLRVVPEADGISNEDGRRPQIWEEIAQGEHDNVYRMLGRRFAFLDGKHGRTAPMILEPAWELSGTWYAWSAAGQLADGRAAWQLVPDGWARIVDAFRRGYLAEAGKHCPYSWVFRPARAVLAGGVRLDRYLPPPGTWDAIGVTCHDNPPFCSTASPRAAWEPALDKSGLALMEGWNLLAELAERFRRGVAFLEWSPYPPDSTTYPGNPQGEAFIQAMWDFLNAHSPLIAAEAYFDRAATSLGSRPDWTAAQRYRQLWGRMA